MQKFFLFLISIIIIASCKKKKEDTSVDPNTIRLTKIVRDNAESEFYEYDTDGRIIKVTRQTTGNPISVLATVTYTANTATLTYPSVINAGLNATSSTKYILLNDGKPLQRIREDRLEFLPPVNNEQRSLFNDTTKYEYDAQGLLIKETQTILDSNWAKENVVGYTTSVELTKQVRNYTNANGNVASVIGSGTKLSRNFSSTNGVTYTSNTLFDEAITLAYNSSYSNKTDFKNIFILNELSVFFNSAYYANKNYQNFPSKISSQFTEKNAINNVITYSSTYTNDYSYTYNSNGFVASIKQTNNFGNSTTIQHFYNP
jgi:YD repeat-containing protein